MKTQQNQKKSVKITFIMKKIMISQPMHGFTDEQIVETNFKQ